MFSKFLKTIIDCTKLNTIGQFANAYANNEIKRKPNNLANAFEGICVTMMGENLRNSASKYEAKNALKVLAEQCKINEIPVSGSKVFDWRQIMSQSAKTKSPSYSIVGNEFHMVLTKEVLAKFNGLIETQWNFYGPTKVDTEGDFGWDLAKKNFSDMEDDKVALMKRGRRILLLFMEACLMGKEVLFNQSKMYLEQSIITFGKDFNDNDFKDPRHVINKLNKCGGYPATLVLEGVALNNLAFTPGIDQFVVKDGNGRVASSVISVLPKVGFALALIDVNKFKSLNAQSDVVPPAEGVTEVKKDELLNAQSDVVPPAEGVTEVKKDELSEGGNGSQSCAEVSTGRIVDFEKFKLSEGGNGSQSCAEVSTGRIVDFEKFKLSEDDAQSLAEVSTDEIDRGQEVEDDVMLYVVCDGNLLDNLIQLAVK